MFTENEKSSSQKVDVFWQMLKWLVNFPQLWLILSPGHDLCGEHGPGISDHLPPGRGGWSISTAVQLAALAFLHFLHFCQNTSEIRQRLHITWWPRLVAVCQAAVSSITGDKTLVSKHKTIQMWKHGNITPDSGERTHNGANTRHHHRL